MRKNNLSDRVALNVPKARQKAHSKPIFRISGGRGALTLLAGAVLLIGGLTATLNDGFAAKTIFKLSQLLPDRLVTRYLALFDEQWLPEMVTPPDAIRREFFEGSIPFGDIIHEKAEKYDVDPALVAAMIEQESRFHKNAISPVGARGLMQLMPRTGRWMGARDLYDAEQNIDAGVRYIKYLDKRFNGNLKNTIAAYNAGEGNVLRYKGIPPFRETQHYVKKVLGNYDKRQKQFKRFEREQIRGGATIDPDIALTVR